MEKNINFVRAKLATTDLFESIICLQAGGRFPEIHREAIEEHFAELARELGYQVEKINAEPAVEAGDPPMFRPRPGLSQVIGGAAHPVRGASLEAAE